MTAPSGGGFTNKVNRSTGQDRRCALLAAAQVLSNSATRVHTTRNITDTADSLLAWLEQR